VAGIINGAAGSSARWRTLANPINVSAAINRLARHRRDLVPSAISTVHNAVERLEEHVINNVGVKYSPHALAVSADGLSKLGAFRSFDAIRDAALALLGTNDDSFNAQDIALTANAFARRAAAEKTSKIVSLDMFSIWKRGGSFGASTETPREASLKSAPCDACYAKTTATSRNCGAVDRRRCDDRPGADENGAQRSTSRARCSDEDAELFAALASVAIAKLSSLSAQNLANLAHACAKAGYAHGPLFDAIAVEANERFSEFTRQNMVITVWAFSKAGDLSRQSKSLFEQVQRRVVAERFRDYAPADIAILTWSFASLQSGCWDDLFSGLERVVSSKLGKFSPHDLSNIAWAFASLNRSASRRMTPHLADLIPANEDDQGLANPSNEYYSTATHQPFFFSVSLS